MVRTHHQAAVDVRIYQAAQSQHKAAHNDLVAAYADYKAGKSRRYVEKTGEFYVRRRDKQALTLLLGQTIL